MDRFLSINGIGLTAVLSLLTFAGDVRNVEIINNLLTEIPILKSTKNEKSKKSKTDKKIVEKKVGKNEDSKNEIKLLFEGKKAVFTGKLEKMNRKEAQELFESLGGKCTTGVTSKTNYLIVGGTMDTKTSKYKKALEFNVEIWSEEQWMAAVSV